MSVIKRPKIEAVLFDFDGVLCTDRFYTNLHPDFPHVLKYIADEVFSGPKYCDRWMRGEFTSNQINVMISRATGIDVSLLNDLFITSVRNMTIEPDILRFAKSLREKNIPTALVTNNMDVFNDVTVPEKGLNKVFPVIVNSSDHGIMKHDSNGKLFDIARDQLGIGTYKGTWLIDDVLTYCTLFSQKGGHFHHFRDTSSFKQWSRAMLA